MFENLNDPEEIAKLEEEMFETFHPEQLADAGLLALDDDDGDRPQRFLDICDLGVSTFRTSTVPEMCAMLGVPYAEKTGAPFLPFMASFLGPKGEPLEAVFPDGKPLDDATLLINGCQRVKAMWHQWVGLCALVERGFKGNNAILADGVGVGKTLTCLMLISWARHYALALKKGQSKPPIGMSRLHVRQLLVDCL